MMKVAVPIFFFPQSYSYLIFLLNALVFFWGGGGGGEGMAAISGIQMGMTTVSPLVLCYIMQIKMKLPTSVSWLFSITDSTPRQ